jgi:hypothetical protein
MLVDSMCVYSTQITLLSKLRNPQEETVLLFSNLLSAFGLIVYVQYDDIKIMLWQEGLLVRHKFAILVL